MALAVTVRSSLGLLSPFLSSTADAGGRKRSMLLAMALFSTGLLLVALWPSYVSLFAALALASLGKIIFDPAALAFVGDRVHYSRRGLAVGLTELGWSGSFLLGIPLVGWLIARRGWLAPFPWLAGLGLAAAGLLWWLLPAEKRPPLGHTNFHLKLRALLAHRPPLAALGFGLIISAANETVTIVYGAWLEGALGLQVAALGLASAVIGLSEFSGEGLVAALSDRIGIQRAVLLGVSMNTVACLALPLLGGSTGSALAGLFLFYLTFEFTIVSTIPLVTELLPEARATLLGGFVAALSLGRALGDLLGPPLFRFGFLANGSAAAALNLLGLALLILIAGSSRAVTQTEARR